MPQEGKARPNDLVGAEMDGHDGVQESSAPPASIATMSPSQGFPSPRPRKSGHGPDSIIPSTRGSDTGTLGEDLADGREQQDRPAGDLGRQDEREIDHVGAAAVASAGRPTRTR